MTPEQRLVEIARSYVGTLEEGHNRGKMVEAFQKAVDGYARGEPWCVAFVQYCVRQVDQELGRKNGLFSTEHAMSLWDKTPKEMRLKSPEPGCLAVWQQWDGASPTMNGHVGIVVEIVNEKLMRTVEGNTGPGTGIVREGDGVHLRSRFIYASGPTMRLRGFLRCWPYSDAIGDPSESPAA